LRASQRRKTIAGLEAIAVGSLAFVENVKGELGVKATHREVGQREETYALREPSETYGANLPAKMMG